MSSEQKQCEKGNVARIVDRLSKDYGSSGVTNSISVTKSENVPLRNRMMNSSLSAFGLPFQTTETAVVRFSYAAQQPDELDLKEGDELAVLAHTEDGWARGEIINSPNNPARKGLIGMYPTNFVSTSSPTPSKQIPPVLTSPSSTFPRAIDSSHDKAHQENSHSTLTSGVSAHQLSSSAPKPSLIGDSLSLGNGVIGTTSPGVLHTGNVLPSSILRGSTVSARSGESCGRRITTENSSNAHSLPLEKETAKVLYKYDAAAPDELSLPEGAVVNVISRQCEDEGWFIAESSDGRKGLFPDNFVKFLPSESSFQGPSQILQQPPSLPLKPQKFVNTTQGHPQPVAFVRDSLFSDSSPKHTFMVSETKTTISEINTDKLMTTSAISLSNDSENNNNINLTNTNIPGNRHSMIAGMQKILFPNGKLPLQQPGSRNSTILGSGGKTDYTIIAEPKMTDFDNNNNSCNSGKQLNNKLLASSSIVNARTKIVPSNKRPPSKVNSAAMLASNNTTTKDYNTTTILDTTTTTTTTTTTINSKITLSPTTTGNTKTTTTTIEEEINQFNQRYIPIGGEKTNKSTTLSSHVPSIYPSINSIIPLTKGKGVGESIPLISSSPESIRSINTDNKTIFGGISCLSSQQQQQNNSTTSSSSSQWISRVDFERFVEECNRRFSEMNGEIVDLRRKLELIQNKHINNNNNNNISTNNKI